MIKIIFLILFIFSNICIANDFKLSSNVVTVQIQNVIDEIQNELPLVLKKAINSEIKVYFKNLNKKEIDKIDSNCSGKIVVGQHQAFLGDKNTIFIDNVFVHEIHRGNRELPNCIHKTIKTYLKATIAHELAHIFDLKNNSSSDSIFLNISGWNKSGIIFSTRNNLNDLKNRSPDIYEFKNKYETFAVNFEHFLYDKNFKCHRPVFFDYFAKLFQVKQFSNSVCEGTKKIVVTSSNLDLSINDAIITYKDLDLSRLYQIHYFFAGKGDAMMSRFGHAMFRLIFCAPNKKIGPDCMNDVSSHVVLSFRANIRNLSINAIDGLTGKYPSELFFLKMKDVIEEYTIGENRELRSLPLYLNRTQMKFFLEKIN